MKYTLLCIGTLFYVTTYGQVAIIQDADGFTNVRKLPHRQAKIIHKIYQNEVFWYNDEASKFRSVRMR